MKQHRIRRLRACEQRIPRKLHQCDHFRRRRTCTDTQSQSHTHTRIARSTTSSVAENIYAARQVPSPPGSTFGRRREEPSSATTILRRPSCLKHLGSPPDDRDHRHVARGGRRALPTPSRGRATQPSCAHSRDASRSHRGAPPVPKARATRRPASNNATLGGEQKTANVQQRIRRERQSVQSRPGRRHLRKQSRLAAQEET